MSAAAVDVYSAGLRSTGGPEHRAGDWRVRYSDGRTRQLDLSRWSARSWPGDDDLLDRCRGPVLDVGCGPGRLTRALATRAVPVLGLDIAPGAVRLAQRCGARVLQQSVFGPVPSPGCWRDVVLADGNIGIGGSPRPLLRRVHELLGRGGQVLCEVDPPGSGSRRVRIRLEGSAGLVSSWFPWAHMDADDVAEVAALAQLQLVDTWRGAERWFVTLVK